jgi:uncharacterized OsmC-like protein
MVEIKMEYLGGLRVEAVHGPSSTSMVTDAPVDNCGRGESFSPTDLVGVAFGTCVMTVMGIAADKRGWNIVGTKVRVEKTMIADPHRRIDSLAIQVTGLPAAFDEAQRRALEAAGNGCPVHHTLRADTKVELTYRWDG